MTSDQKKRVSNLLAKNYSLGQIVKEINEEGVNKSAISRAFPREDTTSKTVGNVEAADEPKKSADSETKRLAVERSHERGMAKLALKREALTIERSKLQLEETRAANEARLITLQEEKQFEKTDKQLLKQARLKAKLLTRYKVALEELIDNCVDSTWSQDEVEGYIDDLQDLKERVTEVATQEGCDEETLALWQNIDYLIDFMQEELDDQPYGLIELDLDEDEVKELEDLKVLDFDEEYVEEEEEETESRSSKKASGKTEKLVEKVNDLVQQLHDGIEEDEFWSEDDADGFWDKIRGARKEVLTLAKALDLDPDSLAIVRTLNQLYGYMDDCFTKFESINERPNKKSAYYRDNSEKEENEEVKIDILDGHENTILDDWQVDEFEDTIDDGHDE